MASEILHVADRRVKIVTGANTQTINVCFENPEAGVYQHKLRISTPASFVSADELSLREFPTLDAFIAYVSNQGGIEENSVGQQRHVPIAEPDAEWSDDKKCIVESQINRCVLDFMRQPYLHRVEHSLHIEMCRRLAERQELLEQFIRFDDRSASIVQKEWPETVTRPEKADRRGSFDISILAPTSEITRGHFIGGYIRPAFVIEVCLNYGKDHFIGDFDKLRNSHIRWGYLAHFARPEGEPQEEVEAYIAQVEKERSQRDNNWPQIVYARLTSTGDWRVKLLGHATIESRTIEVVETELRDSR